MSKANTTCRVCGREYFCCVGRENINSWKTMACSPECFKEYMKRIDASRKPNTKQETIKPENELLLTKAKNGKKKVMDDLEEAENIIRKQRIE